MRAGRKRIIGGLSILGLLIALLSIARVYDINRIAECMIGTWTENGSARPVFSFQKDMSVEHITEEKGRHIDRFCFVTYGERKIGVVLLDEMGDWCSVFHLEYIDPQWLGYREVDDYGNPGEIQWLFKKHNKEWRIEPDLAESFGNEYWEMIDCDQTDENEISERLEFHYNVHTGEYWLIKTYTERDADDRSQVTNSRPWYGTIIMKDETLRIYENPWKCQKFKYHRRGDNLEITDSDGRKAVYQRHFVRRKTR